MLTPPAHVGLSNLVVAGAALKNALGSIVLLVELGEFDVAE